MPKSKSKKRGKHTPPFTAAQKKAIAAAYRKGGNLIGLSAQYKCSTSKIRKVLSEANVTMRPRGPVAKPKAKKVSKPKAKKVSKPKAKKVSKPKAKKVSKKANSGLAKALAAVAEKHAVAPSA